VPTLPDAPVTTIRMRQSSTAHGSARAEQRYRDRHVCSGCAVIDEDRLAAEQRARVLIDHQVGK